MYLEQMRDYFASVIQTRENLVLAIVDKETEKHLKTFSLQSIDKVNRSAEFAIIIGDKRGLGQRGRGRSGQAHHCSWVQRIESASIVCGTSSANMGMPKIGS